jgi:hypothetical protein
VVDRPRRPIHGGRFSLVKRANEHSRVGVSSAELGDLQVSFGTEQEDQRGASLRLCGGEARRLSRHDALPAQESAVALFHVVSPPDRAKAGSSFLAMVLRRRSAYGSALCHRLHVSIDWLKACVSRRVSGSSRSPRSSAAVPAPCPEVESLRARASSVIMRKWALFTIRAGQARRLGRARAGRPIAVEASPAFSSELQLVLINGTRVS